MLFQKARILGHCKKHTGGLALNEAAPEAGFDRFLRRSFKTGIVMSRPDMSKLLIKPGLLPQLRLHNACAS